MRKRCKWYQVCPMKYYYENGYLDVKWVNNFCFKDCLNCKRYQMEEKGEFHPDNMLPDGSIDKTLPTVRYV